MLRPAEIAPLLLLALVTACDRAPRAADTQSTATTRPADGEVVVYTALDRQFSEPILREFETRTGIRALPVFDTESTKTVGLANRIRAEAARPRCDVFWNNEIVNTFRLKREGLLQPCRPAGAERYPAQYRDADGYWHGFAARARVLLVNTEFVPETARPTSIRDLGDSRWRGRTGIAKPLFGTTASHIACLWVRLGPDAARELLAAWRANEIYVAAGNKAVAELVGAGRLAFGLTDTDDAIIEIEAGRPVSIVFPDSGEQQMGTLVLPNTLALVRGCPHPDAGVRLIEYLLGPDVEARLAAGPSAQIPLHPDTPVRSRAVSEPLRPMAVEFAAAADAFGETARYIEDTFLSP